MHILVDKHTKLVSYEFVVRLLTLTVAPGRTGGGEAAALGPNIISGTIIAELP